MRAVLPLALLTGCFETEEMSGLEALEALRQVGQSGRGTQATTEVVEISTDFTIGAALDAYAQAVGAFWESQAPCSTVTITGNVVTTNYGTLNDTCTWNGRTYAGVNTITITSTTLGELEVMHDWNQFTNGPITVDGEAVVTWSDLEATRRVVTDHTWSDDAGHRVEVTGDHVQGRIDDDGTVWGTGFTLDGDRDWTDDAGARWSLEMRGLTWMLIDPAPETGTTEVVAPDGKTLAIEYARVDDDTISATLVGVRGGDRVYHISRIGTFTEAE